MKFEKLENIAEVIAGQSPPSDTYNKTGEGLPFFQGKADFGDMYPTVRYWCTKPTKIATPGDILMSVRAPVGPVNLCDVEACIGRGLAAIRVDNKHYPKYVYYYLRDHEKQIAKLGVGSTFSSITQKEIKGLKIPLPDTISDEIIIATILSKAENLIKCRKDSIALLDELLKSAFLELFYSNPETNEWEEVLFSKLGNNDKGAMRTGPFGSSLLHSEFTETGDVKVLGIDNVVKNSFDWKKSRCITNEKFKELKRYQVFPGDVLISIMATTGRTAVVPDNIPTSINSKHLAAITLNRELANPYFIAFAFHSHPVILRQLKSNVKGAIMEGLNLTIIKKIKFKRPPIELQNTFAKIVEEVEALKTQQQQSLQELENLYGSLSQLAFKGELNLSNISLSPFEVDGKPWPVPGGKGYGDPFEGIEGLPDDGRMFGAEDFKRLMDTGRWEMLTPENTDYIDPQINDEKVDQTDEDIAEQKDITQMSLDEYYDIPDEIIEKYGSIEQVIIDMEFFLKKHFSDRPIVASDVEDLFNRVYYESGQYFKYKKFKKFIISELEKEKPFLKQQFNVSFWGKIPRLQAKTLV